MSFDAGHLRKMCLAVAQLACFFLLATVQAHAGEEPDPQAKAALEQFMAGPSVFIENQGQWADKSIRFALDASGANVGVTDRGPRFQLFRKTPQEPELNQAKESANETGPSPDSQATEMHEFRVVFDGAAPVVPAGRGKSGRTFNYLVGDSAKQRQAVPSFEALWYDEVFPGIALELQGRRSGLKYNFHVAPRRGLAHNTPAIQGH